MTNQAIDPEERQRQYLESTYEVFNPPLTVGARVDHRGKLIGLHLAPSVKSMRETALAAEIIKVARLANRKANLAQRERMDEEMPEDPVLRGAARDMQHSMGLPTREEFERELADAWPRPQRR